jgi:hypothetical protein
MRHAGADRAFGDYREQDDLQSEPTHCQAKYWIILRALLPVVDLHNQKFSS